MKLSHFFRLTPWVVVPSLVLTAGATMLLYYSIICALDAGGSCFKIPVVIQLFVIAIVWPWIAAIRLVGFESIAIGGIFGLIGSLLWAFFVSCCVRWIVLKIRKKK